MNNRKNQYSALTRPFNMLSLMDQIGVTDPRIPVITEFMKLQMNGKSDSQSSEKTSINKKRVMAVVNKIVRKNDELKCDNELLVDKLNMVASALGACRLCWGEDEACEMCQGKGRPGSCKPDIEPFREFVLPVVKKIHKCGKRNKNSIKNKDSQNGMRVNRAEFSKKRSRPVAYKLYNKVFLENAMAVVKKIRRAA